MKRFVFLVSCFSLFICLQQRRELGRQIYERHFMPNSIEVRNKHSSSMFLTQIINAFYVCHNRPKTPYIYQYIVSFVAGQH